MRWATNVAIVPIMGSPENLQVSDWDTQFVCNDTGDAAASLPTQNVTNAELWKLLGPLEGGDRAISLPNSPFDVFRVGVGHEC